MKIGLFPIGGTKVWRVCLLMKIESIRKGAEMIGGQTAIFIPWHTCPLPTFCFLHLLKEEVKSDGNKKIFPRQTETETEA
ncbi:hypothetical protein [Brevibacillus parabrevis]|uniref:hypothetical protein n=1 Tax=Brevibacillus parabrevis TaxID=54914 RepID=UPI0012F4AA5F|nr:hypothetical protein [Brevibacillus parabrevis]